MKHIQKNPEPQWFVNWKAANSTAKYADLVAAGNAQNLRQSLVDEQHHICCYCECRIEANTSHNEHFKPKGNPLYSSLQLDYDNLFASCLRRPDGNPEMHCGHKKGPDYDPQLISPLESDCSSHFKYDLNGKIIHTDARGKLTIQMLRLDSALLDASRKTLIDYFLNLNPDDMDMEVADHIDTSKTYYGEYYTTIEYLHNEGLL